MARVQLVCKPYENVNTLWLEGISRIAGRYEIGNPADLVVSLHPLCQAAIPPFLVRSADQLNGSFGPGATTNPTSCAYRNVSRN